MTRPASPHHDAPLAAGTGWRPAWRRLRRIAPWLLAATVLALVLRQAIGIDWAAVRAALTGLPWPLLAGAVAVALAGHAVFACYDLVARRVVGHPASAKRSAFIGAVGYALNLNFGALIGGVAVRLRLYRRAGVPLPQAGAVVAGGMLANWCGWATLAAGALLWAQPLPWPGGGPVSGSAWRLALALLLLAAPALLLLACARWSGQALPTWRGLPLPSALRWPSLPTAGLWLLLATLSWALASTVVWMLLQGALPWWPVAGAMLLAAVAGVVTHVPASLGVLEAVLLATLGGAVAPPTLLAALIAYRAVYYGLPLAAALVGYLALESRPAHLATARRGDRSAPAGMAGRHLQDHAPREPRRTPECGPVGQVLQGPRQATPRMHRTPTAATAVNAWRREQYPLMPNLKTFLVEDSPVIRSNLIAALEDLAPVAVVGYADSANDACDQLTALEATGDCDLVIVDVFLKSGSGLDVLRCLRGQDSALRRVVLTNYATPGMRAECLALGASEVFDKSRDIEALVNYCTRLAAN
jgi:uncharacterized membrane protein YbhN (UPF0104 family)/CheY-like chemotaxis protein